MNLSIGKWRGLAQCSTERGVFANLALDHRDSLRRALQPDKPQNVPFHVMTDFKRELVSFIAPESSAVLLDPEIGIASSICSNALPGQVGLLVALESTGYEGKKSARRSEILPSWDVGKIKRIGASGVKLLVYYHPDAPTAESQEVLVAEVAKACVRFDIPFFLEPLSYSLGPEDGRVPSGKRKDVVLETAHRLSALGIDVLKAEFPVDVFVEEDETAWFEACSALTEASSAPWVLLSAAVDFEIFIRQVQVACRAGASGVLAGRAVWKEAAGMDGQERQDFLRTVAVDRMRRLTEICNEVGRPWWDVHHPVELQEGWYRSYTSLG
jgi:tagatose 1,6-diphosphate aldolase